MNNTAEQAQNDGVHSEWFDVIVIGAGLVRGGCRGPLYSATAPITAVSLLLERREAIGGTWDLFRYPGIRSDSDMHTLGYDFKPWLGREIDRRR